MSTFGAEVWSRAVAADPHIVGTALGVALMIGTKTRYAERKLQVPVRTVSERCGVTADYVRDVVSLLVLLGYLTDLYQVINRRAVYAPALPKRKPGTSRATAA